jgi:hypothetical protein
MLVNERRNFVVKDGTAVAAAAVAAIRAPAPWAQKMKMAGLCRSIDRIHFASFSVNLSQTNAAAGLYSQHQFGTKRST